MLPVAWKRGGAPLKRKQARGQTPGIRSRTLPDTLDEHVMSIRRALPVYAWALLALGPASLARADDYRPPDGFNGYTWGTVFGSFKGLELWHANTASGFIGKVTDFRLQCKPDPSDPSITCSPSASEVIQQVQGEGSHAVAEYYFDKDRNPWASRRIELYTISYLFCASTKGSSIPRPLKKHLKLCGARVMFRSDTLAQMAARDVGYESNYDRVLRALVAEHGEPPGYERRGRITVESETERFTTPEKQKPQYARFRWCGVDDSMRQLRPGCEATVTLVFEGHSGLGTVLYATAPLYEFAYARHRMKDENNELYVMLSSRNLATPNRKEKFECTGSHLCSPSLTPMAAKDLREFQP